MEVCPFTLGAGAPRFASGKGDEFSQFFWCLRLNMELGMSMESSRPSMMLWCAGGSKGNGEFQPEQFLLEVYGSEDVF